MTDINAVIAKARGWILNPYEKLGSMYEPSVKWYNPKTGEKLYTHDPDFQGDARLYMGLFKEMISVGRAQINIIRDEEAKKYEIAASLLSFDKKRKYTTVGYCRLFVEFTDFGEGICKLWCAWKGLKYEE